MAVLTRIQRMSQHRNYTNFKVGVPPWISLSVPQYPMAWAGTAAACMVDTVSALCVPQDQPALDWQIVDAAT
jgi:hypothetical protein